MVATVIGYERLGTHGELRCFVREGPPLHFAFEVLQDVDGRAWTLRVPAERKAALVSLLRNAQRRMVDNRAFEFDEAGNAELASERLSTDDEIAAVALQQDGQQAFALWRRERLRTGWSWTLDAVFVPWEHAGELCTRIGEALTRAEIQ